MTILADTSRVIGVATGAGRSWFFPFRFYENGHLAVHVQAPDETGWSALVSSEYTVTPGPGSVQDGWLGGTITYPKVPAAVLPAGWKLRIALAVPYTQPNIDLTNASGFDPRAVEKEFDLCVQRMQQLRDVSDLHLRLPEGSSVDEEIDEPGPGHLLMMNAGGTRFVEGPNGADIALVAGLAGDIIAGLVLPLDPYMYGATGNGIADDYPAVQATLNAAQALNLPVHIPPGTFKLTSGSPKVHSGTTITGAGKGKAILFQPNYFSYDRPGDPYVKGDVVDWNALWMDVGTENVDISGLELRGPFWQANDSDYTSNPVENWPASNGIHVRGADYQWRQGLPITGESANIRIHDCHLEGWAEDAIQCDMVTHLWVERNTIARCGRGGFRGYSCVHSWVQHNSIDTLSPGDYLNNGNRMYGIEFTRTYQSGVRASADFWVVGNRVRNCLQWKGMGTHGGQRGRFLHNDIIDCHHGIGVDKGGFEEGTGIAPPRDIQIVGNRIRRSAAGDETEGNGEGGAGHAIFATAHDGTSTHIGRNIVIANNICEGWGCDALYGGMWIGRWDGVVIGQNVWRNNVGCAIRLRSTLNALSVGPQSIKGVTRTVGDVQRGVAAEMAEIVGTIGPQMVENTSSTELTAIYLASSSGLVVQSGHVLINSGGGTIKEVNSPNLDNAGPLTLSALAVARVSIGGDDSVTVNGHRNIDSVVRESEGTYTVTITKPASSTSTLFPIASSTGGSLIVCQAIGASATTVTVLTKNEIGTLTDGSFMLHVFGF